MKAHELQVSGVSAGYDGTTVLESVSISLKQGERLGILGRNGAGKSTLLGTILGMTDMTEGTVALDGRNLKGVSTEDRVRSGIGLVPQTRDIFPSLTVEENLQTGIYAGKSSKLDQAYALFPRLKERRLNLGNQLSGGEQQMLSIARALMGEPTLLLLDEPLEGLSPVVAHEVMDAIKALASGNKMGCVLVEQHVAVVLEFSTRVLVLERGRPAFYGDVATLKSRPDILESCIGLRKSS